MIENSDISKYESRGVKWDFREDDLNRLYYGDVSEVKDLSDQEMFELALETSEGDLASRRRLIESNTRFAIGVAGKYFRSGGWMNKGDFIQEANEALIRVVDTYKPNLGFALQTYARKVMKNHFIRVFAANLVLSGNEDAFEHVLKYINAERDLREELGRDVLPEEVEDVLGWERGKSNKVLRLVTRADSIDSPTGDSDERKSPRLNRITGENEDIDRDLLKEDAVTEVDYLLSFLPKKEAGLIKLRYSLGYGSRYGSYREKRTLSEVKDILAMSNGYDVTTQMISLVEQRALTRLRWVLSCRAESPEIVTRINMKLLDTLQSANRLDLAAQIISARFRINLEDLLNQKSLDFVLIRGVLAHLFARNKMSIKEISEFLGRDRTTVESGMRRIDKKMNVDPFTSLIYSTIKSDCDLLLTA